MCTKSSSSAFLLHQPALFGDCHIDFVQWFSVLESLLCLTYISNHLYKLSPQPAKLLSLLRLPFPGHLSLSLSLMANVQGTQDVPGNGIKLFGATITLQSRQVKEEQKGADQTVEKRPDKIIPCPRCKSMETKFCYFNNYNVNQPRHFCKGCQRYWTAGGALRNVPIGAGRRKTKPPPHGLGGFSEGCLYDADGLHQFDFDGSVVEEWHVMAAQGGYRNVFPAKRQRSGSGGQACP
jgi:hypothetical protein